MFVCKSIIFAGSQLFLDDKISEGSNFLQGTTSIIKNVTNLLFESLIILLFIMLEFFSAKINSL